MDNDRPLRFIRIPKTGSDSLINTLGRECEVGHHHTLTSIDSEEREGYFFAAFVRNPWDRLVSKWLQIKKAAAEKRKNNPNIAIIRQYESFNDFAQDINNIPISKECIVIEDHITWVFLPCCHWLYNEQGRIAVDFIGRFENLYIDYVQLCKQIDMVPVDELPHTNKAKDRQHYSSYYTSNKAIQAVADFAKDDIMHFGYKFTHNVFFL